MSDRYSRLQFHSIPPPLTRVLAWGYRISFSLDVNFGPDPTTFNYTGVLTGNEMKLHTDFTGQPIDYTVKKGA